MRAKRPIIALFLTFLPMVSMARQELSLEDRIACQWSVQEVYWRHTDWPAANPGPKPPLLQVLSASSLERQVEKAGIATRVLDEDYGIEIDARMLQTEMDRMARDTKSPDVLRELFAALDHDATRIGECLARPLLADRLLRQAHAQDRRLERASDDWLEEVVSTRIAPRSAAPSVMGLTVPAIAGSGCADTWSSTGIDGATPAARRGATGVWTGTHLIVWGGEDGNFAALGTGGRYDPATDSWLALSMIGAPVARDDHDAVWTGTRMVVWGGQIAGGGGTASGGLYDPLTDTWAPTSTIGAPSARMTHVMVWTGTEALVWGGRVGGPPYPITGGLYDPANDTWRPTSTGAGLPTGRYGHSAVWTGTQAILWAGTTESGSESSGARYHLVSDTWSSTSLLNAPGPRRNHPAIWTGTEMIVWGGSQVPASDVATGGRYDPVADVWKPMSQANQPARQALPAIAWTGTDMLVVGESATVTDGGRYFPDTDTWLDIPLGGASHAKIRMTWAWAEGIARLLVWGGGNTVTNTGAVFCPCAAGLWFEDLDGDGHGTTANRIRACAQPEGYAAVAGDCDDTLASRFPGNAELCDGVDNDCNLSVDDAPLPGAVSLSTSKSGTTILLDWFPVPGASVYDVTRGALTSLRASSGDFTTATEACVADDLASPSASDAGVPPPAEGFWYLTRAGNCAGPGTYDEDPGTAQQSSRDAEIAASGLGCP